MTVTRKVYQAPRAVDTNQGSALLHAQPELAVAELERYHPVTAADATMRDYFVEFARHTPGFTSPANYKFGHMAVVAGVVSPRGDALGMFRTKTGEWQYPQGHLTQDDESFQAAAVRIASLQLGLAPHEFVPLLDAPVSLTVIPGQISQGDNRHYHNLIGFSFRASKPGLYAPSINTYADWKTKEQIEPALEARAEAQKSLTRVLTSVLVV